MVLHFRWQLQQLAEQALTVSGEQWDLQAVRSPSLHNF
jgi:hypothetical protein